MKFQTTLIAGAIFALVAAVWATVPEVNTDPTKEESEMTLRTEKMNDRKAEIGARLGVSAPLEMPEPGDEDIVAAMEPGWIIEVTLEEAEAALNAAKQTPEIADDLEAMRLIHRGSFRYYMDAPADKK